METPFAVERRLRELGCSEQQIANHVRRYANLYIAAIRPRLRPKQTEAREQEEKE
jgi:hypothetical protein